MALVTEYVPGLTLDTKVAGRPLPQAEVLNLARQLASAVGLGGRDRKTGSEAERARSAVTKRIKNSINRIGEVVPSLRSHLAVRVKTGYFCSYNPHPERPVVWRF